MDRDRKTFPIRSESHQLEELSERYFCSLMPKNWLAEKPRNDYGVDLRLDLFEGESATGLELLVQLKASSNSDGEHTETARLKTSTYNLLWEKLQVAMLVKYIESEREAYWVLFRDIPAPDQEKDTFTVHIPKTNRLRTIPWPEIQKYVQEVTDTKLAAMQRERMASKERGK